MNIPLACSLTVCTLAISLVSLSRAAETCELYPITLSAQSLINAAPGDVLPDVLNGSQSGNFGWLAWAGSPSEPTLVKSLTPPGDSSTYVNPENSPDHQISLGDWIQAKPGVSNSKKVRDALDALKQIDITVPVWDQARGQGANAQYRVSGFARVRLLGYHLPGQNRITARFLGLGTCGVINLAPVVNAGADLTNALHVLPATVNLHGTVTDDGLPTGGTLVSEWSVVSGPGTVTFSDSHSPDTVATFALEGTYVLQLAASDSELGASDTVIVTINRVNQPPVAYPTNVVTDEDTPILITLPASDPDGDPLEYIIASSPNYGTLNGSGATYLYTPCRDCNTTAEFTFRVHDGFLESSNAPVTITILPVNDRPVADSIAVTNNEDTTFAIELSGSDVEGSPLTFTVLTSPTNGTLATTSSNVVFYTPSNNFFGQDSFTFKVNDGELDSLPATNLVVVAPVNDPPIVDAGADQLISLPVNGVTLQGTVTDDEFPTAFADVIEWSLVNGPGSVTFTDSNEPITTATFSASGVYTLQLLASDSLLTSTDLVVITVNARPLVNAGADFTNTLPATITLNGSASDDALPTNGTLSVLWEKVSGPGIVTFETPASTNTVVQFSASGVYVLSLTASDSVVSTTDEIIVTINRPPIVDAGSDQTNNTLQVQLLGTVADDGVPEGASAAPIWAKVSGPGDVTFDAQSSPSTVATFTQSGIYILRLSADDTIASTSDDVRVVINGVPSVSISPTPFIVNLGTNGSLVASITDDGLPFGVTNLVWSVESGPSGTAFSSITAAETLVSFTITGTYVLRATVDDGFATNFAAVPAIANDIPVVNAGAPQTIRLPATATLAATVEDSGLPFGVLTVQWTQLSGPASVSFSDSTIRNPIVTFTVSGSYVLQITGNDGFAQASSTVTITVLPENHAPVVNAGSDFTNNFEALTTLHGSVTDDGEPAGAPVTVQWSKVSGPGAVTFGNANAAETTASFGAPGIYILHLEANDTLASASDDVRVRINALPQAVGQTVSLDEDTTAAITLTGSDADADALTFEVIASPQHGAVTGTAPNLIYIPATNYFGPDSLTFRVSDGLATSAVATVSLTVNAVNDAPVVNGPVAVSLAEDSAFAFLDTNSVSVSDIDAGVGTITVLLLSTNGSLNLTVTNGIEFIAGANGETDFAISGLLADVNVALASLVYLPATNFNGVHSLTVTANDQGNSGSGGALTDTRVITITVGAVNDAPVANNQNLTVNEDTALPITLTGSDTEGSLLTYMIVTSPAHGTLSGTPPNVTYLPAANYYGSDSFTFQANDGDLDSAVATVSITVLPINDVPTANSQSVTSFEDAVLAITLTGSDVEGSALTYAIVDAPTHGTLSGTPPNVSYLPATNYYGADTFTFKVNDGELDSAVATVSITVQPVNDAPFANNQNVSVNEDTALALALTGSDVEGSALTFAIVTSPAHGTLSGTPPNLVYQPATNYNGADSFTFRVNDGELDSAAATVLITVLPVNDAPIASNQNLTTDEDTTLAITLAGSDVEGSTLTYTIVAAPAYGTLSGTAPNVSYLPATNYHGSDSFTFKVNDGELDSTVATITINVNAVNDAPFANGQMLTVNEDTTLPITLSGSDVEGSTLTYALLTTPTNGTLSGTAPNLVYLPNTNFNGGGSFTFRVNDGVLDSGSATIVITVNAVNDAPFANAQTLTVNEDTALAITLGGSDVEGSALGYTILTTPTNGTLSGTAPDLVYLPNTNFNGGDSFTFKVNDGELDSLVAIVAITVNPVNDAPTVNNQSLTVNEDTALPITLTGADVEGSALTFAIVASPAHGTLTGTPPNVSYRPATNFTGADSFTFKANDGDLDSSIGTVSINVLLVNDRPVALNQSHTNQENQVFAITLTAVDPDGDTLTFQVTTVPAHGVLSGTAPNLTYTPATNYFGTDSFQFIALDGITNSLPATVSIYLGPLPRSRVYTTTADFNQGQFFKALGIENDEMTLGSKAEAFNNLWVAVSSKDTIVRIDTETGEVRGEYRSAPQGQPGNPSRTTVDLNGSAWAANRSGNSVVHIAVPESGLWQDRNGNGIIDTSTGLGDVRPWLNAGGINTTGGVSAAEDELILHYVKVRSSGTRHVSVNASNDVWVSGTGGQLWDLIDGDTGQIIRQEPSVGWGAYGGLIDRHGVIWSSGPLLRWDTSKPLTGPNGGNWTGISEGSYGIGLDSLSNVWVSQLFSGKILKFAADGTLLGRFNQGAANAQGVAVGLDDHVWVAHSLLGGNTVAHLKNDGTWIGNVKVGEGPTGVAVDVKGKVWVTNYRSGNVMRIDPSLGPLGSDGETPVGEVDYISPYLGGALYNYSDMTGSTLTGFPGNATWSAVFDSTISGAGWGKVAWNSRIYDDGKLTVTFSTSEDGTSFGPEETLAQPNAQPTATGRYAKIKVVFVRASTGKGPILYDLTLGTTGYDAPVITPLVNIDAGPDRELQLPLAAVLQASLWHNGFLTYNTNQTYTWSAVSGPGTVIFENPNAALTEARFSTLGDYVVRASTTLEGVTYGDDVHIHAIPINRSPWVHVGSDRALRSTNDVLHLAATARDDGLPDGSTMTLQWSNVFGPGAVTFSSPNSATTDVQFAASGFYVLELSATDGDLIYSDRLEVRVQAVCESSTPAGIVQWWPGNGDTLEWVRGNYLFLQNGTTYTNAQVGHGFFFNGTTNYAKAFEHPSMDIGIGAAFTVEFWIKPSTAGRVFEWRNHTNLLGAHADYNGTDTITVNLVGTNNASHAFSFGSLSKTQFKHVGITYERSRGVATVYIDGFVHSTHTLGSFATRTLGDFYFGSATNAVTRFGGTLDEFALYNRALNGQEIYEIAQAKIGGRWPLDNNLAPIVNAGVSNLFAMPGDTLTLNGNASDDSLPEGIQLFSEWRTVSGPTGASFGNASQPSTTVSFAVGGLYVIELYADDAVKATRKRVEARIGMLCTVEEPPGIVGWWPANNSEVDVINPSRSAARVNGTTYTNGFVGAAFRFDGINDYVQASAAAEYNVGASTNGLTMELWARGPTSGGFQRGIAGWHSTATGGGVRFYHQHDTVFFQLWDTNGVLQHSISIGGVFNDTWQHIAGTYDRASGLSRLYVNGVLRAISPVVFFTPDTRGDFYTGFWPSLSTFAGQLDEVSIYNRALNPQEIYEVYASGSVGKCPEDDNTPPVVFAGPDRIGYIGVPLTLSGLVDDDGLPAGSTLRIQWSQYSGPAAASIPNATSEVTSVTFPAAGIYVLQLAANDGSIQRTDLVEVRVEALCTVEDPIALAAWWPANGTEQDVINDRLAIRVSGNGYAVGKVASAFHLDGTDDYVWMPRQPEYNVGASTNGLTMELWARGPTSGGFQRGIAGWHSTATGGGVRFYHQHDTVFFQLWDTNGVLQHSISIGGVFNDTWQHIAGTYDRASGLSRLYVNGVLRAISPVVFFTPDTRGDFYTGFWPSLSTFAGQLDEVSIYNRALNPQEIYEVYASGSVGKCPEDDNTPPVVFAGPDRIGYIGVPLTLSGLVDDDGLPAGSTLRIQWSQYSGPAAASIPNATSEVTSVTFPAAGIYVLQLAANDGSIQRTDLVEVRVEALCTVEDPIALAAWWPANGTEQDVINDRLAIRVSGNGYAVGKVASAFHLDGTDDYVWMPRQPEYNVGASTNGLTMELWARGPTSGGFQRGIAGWHSTATGGGVRFYHQHDTVFFQLWDTNGVLQHSISIGGVFNDTWQHIAGTYDRASGLSRLYVNGVLRAISPVVFFTPDTRGDFYTGFWPSLSTFAGQLDEVSIYNRALNPQEIYEVYASGSVGKCPEDDNTPPVVFAGPDRIGYIGVPLTLSGLVDDDGLPAGSTLRIQWSQYSGPAAASIPNATSEVTSVTFPAAGIYVLQLAANDGSIQRTDLVEVRVEALCTVEDPIALAAWWPANGTEQDVINDRLAIRVSGNGYAVGKVASAFHLDGTDDYVWMPRQPEYNVGASTNGLTMELWARGPTSGGFQRGIAGWHSTATGGGVRFYHQHDTVFFQLWDTNGVLQHSISIGGVFNDTWQHIAGTYDRASGLSRLYVNGVLRATSPVVFFTPDTRGDFYTGFWPSLSTFAGQLDEVSIYNRALNPQEIYEVYASGSVGKCPEDDNTPPVVFAGPDRIATNAAPITLEGFVADDGLPAGSILGVQWSKFAGPGTVSFGNATNRITTATFTGFGVYVLQLTANDGSIQRSDLMEVRVDAPCTVTDPVGLVGWWPANGTEQDRISQRSAIRVSGTNYGMGKVASAFHLDGTDDYVWMPRQPEYNVGASTNGLTMELWARGPTSGGFQRGIAGWHSTATGGGVRFYHQHDTVFFQLWDTNGVLQHSISIGGVFNDTWQHIAGTYDRASGLSRLYVNGVLRATSPVVFFTPDTRGDFYTGFWPSLSTFAGQLDEVSIYNRTLSQTQIQAIYDSGIFGKCLTPPNLAPIVSAGGDQLIYFPSNAVLQGVVFDDGLPQGSSVTHFWSYVSGPAPVIFGDTNQLVTALQFATNGNYRFDLVATDGEFTVSDSVMIFVIPDPRTPPTITINNPADGTLHEVPAGGTTNVTVTAAASDSDGIINQIEFFQNGASIAVLTNGPYAVPVTNGPGTYTFTAIATDNDGLRGTSAPVQVTIYVDTGAPIVQILTPLDGSAVTAPTVVTGTVSSSILESYELQYRLKDADEISTAPWITFATGTVAVANGPLGTLDPTLLLNGIYELQLVATDSKGRIGISEEVTVVVDRNMKVGHFTLSFNDLTVPVAGIPIQVIRTYDSRDKRIGDFGVGWMLDIKNIRLQKNRNLGAAWEQTFQSGGLGQYCLIPRRPRVVTITFPDGKTQKFEAHTSPECQPFAPIPEATVTWRPQLNTRGTLVAEGANADSVMTDSHIGITELFTETFATYNPTLFRYTSDEGEVYIIDERQGLKQMTDRNGNRLTVNTNGIVWTNIVTGGPGKSVAFQRDNVGRITNILDAAGNAMRYRYDTNGNLVSFVDRVNLTNTFSYNTKHEMLTLTDARGITAARNEYDDEGRLVRQIDAAGNTNTFTHDLDARAEIIRDRLGYVTVHEYDENGNITRSIDALNNVTLMTYDANDNLLTKVDALGNTNRFTYDAHDNKLSETDPLGNTTTYTYKGPRQPTSTRDARNHTTTNIYDVGGNIATILDAQNHRADFSYHAQGDIRVHTDALGNTMENGYDQFGHLTNTTVRDVNLGVLTTTAFLYDANGNQTNKTMWRTTPTGVEPLVTTYIYDSANRRVLTIYPNGSTNATIYNANNKPSVGIDALGRRTVMDYDDRGNLTRTTYPDGTFEITFYDAENRRIGTQDQAGRITSYINDALGRLVVTVYPDNTGTTNFYDAIGRVLAVSDSRGNTTFYGYDAEGRCTSTTNALGQVSRSVFDEVGNLVQAIDALGRTNIYVYDELDRMTTVFFADGTSQHTIYDALGRRIADMDQSFNTTVYGFDALGRLTAITNSLGNVTRYEYNEQGQQTAEIDAELRTTRFEYDQYGRRTKRILPLNQFETYRYDVAGRMTNRTDFNGRTTTFIHDVMNRLVAKVPDPSFAAPPVQFGYNELGFRTNMVDASGVTVYRYDNRDRLIEKATPQGTVTYGYNVNGQVTNIHSLNANGVTLSYSYDALNRLNEVNDPHAGNTTYTYDAAGNLRGYTYPNGVNTFYEYNALNRLTNMNVSAGVFRIANYAYTLAASGHRTAAAETLQASPVAQVTTLTRLYRYDTTYRLTNETIGGTSYATPAMLDYGYDKVGNRRQLASTHGAISSASYDYDANDRLLSDTYDNNGNTLTAPGFGMAQPDQYDFENRLVRRTEGSKTVAIVYDGDGNRVKKTVTTATNTVTTGFLVDMVNPTGYAQVLEEITTDTSNPQLATPQVTRIYGYGHDLISQDRLDGSTWTLSFYGYDGHGNTRFLTDVNAAVTDTYDYDAFGNLFARTGSTPNQYLFTGEQYDSDLGLYFLRARYQNTQTGRFWTMDEFEGFHQDPLSLHKYTYANDNPVSFSDPSGNWTLKEVSITMGVGAIISAAISTYVNWDKTGEDFWIQIGKDAAWGAITAPIGGWAIRSIAKVIKPIAKIALQPLFKAIGELSPIVLHGGRWTARNLLVRMSRFFFNTNQTYPSVESTLTGKILKWIFGKELEWDMHHILMRQAWSRAGSSLQWYSGTSAEAIAANEGLRRVANGLWNLIPLPSGLHGVLHSAYAGPEIFATLYYGTVVWGASFYASVLYGED